MNLNSYFRLEFRRKRTGEIAAFGRIYIAAAGLRHSRAPFLLERDCAESQSQQRDLADDPSYFAEMSYENRYSTRKYLSRSDYGT
jgi:hypothetical protein